MDSPYHRLRARIDELPIPFPQSETGAEIRLLEALFSEEEAEVAIHLSAVPEPVETIYPRVAALVPDVERLAAILKELGRRGAINVSIEKHRGKGGRCYGLAPLVVGMFEFQVNKLTREFVEDFHEYTDHGFRESVVGTRTAQMRTVPVGEAITPDRAVESYDNIRDYIESSPGPFGVMNCVCRQSAELLGEACTTSSTQETCLTIGPGAASTVAAGISRRIKKEEVLQILERADENRCIGCGLCVTKCPTSAIRLVRRKDAKAPPRTTDAMYLRMYRDRFGLTGLVRAGLRKVLGKKI